MPIPSLLAEPSIPSASRRFVGAGSGDTFRARVGMMGGGRSQDRTCDFKRLSRVARPRDGKQSGKSSISSVFTI